MTNRPKTIAVLVAKGDRADAVEKSLKSIVDQVDEVLVLDAKDYSTTKEKPVMVEKDIIGEDGKPTGEKEQVESGEVEMVKSENEIEKLVQKMAMDNLKYINVPTNSQTVAYNRAISMAIHAGAKYFTFIEAGSVSAENRIEELFDRIELAGICFSSYTEKGKTVKLVKADLATAVEKLKIGRLRFETGLYKSSDFTIALSPQRKKDGTPLKGAPIDFMGWLMLQSKKGVAMCVNSEDIYTVS